MNKLQASLGTALCTVFLIAGCSNKSDKSDDTPSKGNTEAAKKSSDPVDTPIADKSASSADEAISEAKKGAKSLGKTLKRRLVGAMQEGGPESALSACAQDAQSLSAGVQTPRLRVGRSTLRLRNPKNAESPAWVQEWLTTTGERKTEGLSGLEEVVDGVARVIVPLTASGMCLGCHGDAASHTDKMKQLLASKYPEDKAVGYENGDLRGVIWAEYDLAAKK